MKVPVYILGNNTAEPVSVVFQQLAVDATAGLGCVAPTASGMLTIQSGKKVTIEQSRVNDGQIHNLAAANLLVATQSYL